MKKRKLEMTEGCTCWSYTVDGKDYNDLTLEEAKELSHKLIDNVTNKDILHDLFTNYLYGYGEYKDLGCCEDCGDCIENYKAEI